MISKTIGFRGTLFSDTPICLRPSWAGLNFSLGFDAAIYFSWDFSPTSGTFLKKQLPSGFHPVTYGTSPCLKTVKHRSQWPSKKNIKPSNQRVESGTDAAGEKLAKLNSVQNLDLFRVFHWLAGIPMMDHDNSQHIV